jgi:hypothetical protein
MIWGLNKRIWKRACPGGLAAAALLLGTMGGVELADSRGWLRLPMCRVTTAMFVPILADKCLCLPRFRRRNPGSRPATGYV